MVDNYWYIRGGAQRYVFELSELLNSKGHEIVQFSAKHRNNVTSEYDEYFADGLTHSDIAAGNLSSYEKMKAGLNSIYSFNAAKKLGELIHISKPDIIHTHSIPYRLTSSVIDAARKENVPVVHTCHEWKALCPNQRLFKSNPPIICEKCKNHKFYNVVREKCIKGSFCGSILGCIEAYLCHFRGTYSHKVDKFIAPSVFVKRKMEKYGFDSNKIAYIPHFINPDKFLPRYDFDNYIIYYGHLTPQKGIKTLVNAMKMAPNVSLLIIGNGELEDELKCMVSTQGTKNVVFKDYIQGENILKYVRNAAFTIIPSVWFETAGLVIYESFALGKPVIGSNIGPIPELVENGSTGLLFDPGNANDLAEKINYLIEKPELILEMGRTARMKIEENYNSDIHYDRLMKVYEHVLNSKES